LKPNVDILTCRGGGYKLNAYTVHVLYSVELYPNTGDVHLQKLIALNSKLLLILHLQSKSCKYPHLYLNVNILLIPELHSHQLLKLIAHKCVHA